MESEKSDYKAFTKAHDQIVHARDLLADMPHEAQVGMEDFLDKWAPEAIGTGVDGRGEAYTVSP